MQVLLNTKTNRKINAKDRKYNHGQRTTYEPER